MRINMAINEINTLRIAFLLLFDIPAPFACSHIVLTHEYLKAFDLWTYFFLATNFTSICICWSAACQQGTQKQRNILGIAPANRNHFDFGHQWLLLVPQSISKWNARAKCTNKTWVSAKFLCCAAAVFIGHKDSQIQIKIRIWIQPGIQLPLAVKGFDMGSQQRKQHEQCLKT